LKDPWKHLREGLFGNVEPEITLEAVTCPLAPSLFADFQEKERRETDS
jgi:hypothetical protein